MINLQPLNSKEYLITEIQKIFIMEKIKKETMKDVLFTNSPRRTGFAIAFYWCSEMQALRESEFTLKSIYQNCEEKFSIYQKENETNKYQSWFILILRLR